MRLENLLVGAVVRGALPDLFATLAVPKAEELVATPYRHGSKEKAETFFLDGMTQAMPRLVEQAHPVFPVTTCFAFEQSETESEAGTSSIGWETILDAVMVAGFGISSTWPMRTERKGRKIGNDTNALASIIVLFHRQLSATASTAPAASSSPPSRVSYPLRCAICRRATTPRWTWRRPPLALAWRSTPALASCSTMRARLCPCARRWRSSTRCFTQPLPSIRATSTLIATSTSPGSSSTALSSQARRKLGALGPQGDMTVLPYSAFHSIVVAGAMATRAPKTDILMIKDVAEYLKVTERTIYRLAAAKKIPAFKVGGSWRFSRGDIDEWIRAQTLWGTKESSE
jgi:excisionase family DNA binding protein